MNGIDSQLIRLVRNVVLSLRPGETFPEASFPVGKQRNRIPRLTDQGFSWWYGDDAFFARDAIATMLPNAFPEFHNVDHESVSRVIMATLQELCLDSNLFETDDVFFRRQRTLFECRKGSPNELTDQLLQSIQINLREILYKRCVIFSVPRIKMNSMQLQAERIRVVEKSDETAWLTLINEGYQFQGWSPKQPRLPGVNDLSFSPPQNFSALLVYEGNGTPAGTRFEARLKLSKFVAIVLAIAERDQAHSLTKSMGAPHDFCLSVPHSSGLGREIERVAYSQPLMPCIANEIRVSNSQAQEIHDWYDRARRCNADSQSRLEKGAYFFNRALNASDIEEYVNYFIAIDALYGARHLVERSITDVIARSDVDPEYVTKLPYLFRLRSEIVHGSSRYLSEWPKYEWYRKRFKSKPFDDLRALASQSLLLAPGLLP